MDSELLLLVFIIIFIIYINTKKYTHIQASYYIQIIYMINTI